MKVNQNTHIECKKCVLVPYTVDLVQRYHQWMESEELRELTASEQLTLSEEYDMQQSWHEDDRKCTFIILDRELYSSTMSATAAMIGDVNLFFNDADDRHLAELEVMIAESPSRGKGIGLQAVVAMMIYGIEQLGVSTFIAKIGTSNLPSVSLFHKLGFQEVERSAVFQEVTLHLSVSDINHLELRHCLPEYHVIELEAQDTGIHALGL